MPKDISLPFFAYGLFKPGELSYFRIKDLVKDYEEAYIQGILKERDGLPILELRNNCGQIKGKIIYFKSKMEEEAYKRIIEIGPKKLYKWQEATINNQKINVLTGRSPNRGSTDLEHVYEWKGNEDPYFSIALDEIEEILRENSEFSWNYKSLFRLQMAYMLLWTAIERYASFRYHLGENATEKAYMIAEEPIFADSLKKHVKKSRKVFKTSDPKKSCILDPNDPKKSIKYYYQVRSNTVHRGKIVVRDFDIVLSSTSELLAIFRDILKHSWNS